MTVEKIVFKTIILRTVVPPDRELCNRPPILSQSEHRSLSISAQVTMGEAGVWGLEAYLVTGGDGRSNRRTMVVVAFDIDQRLSCP